MSTNYAVGPVKPRGTPKGTRAVREEPYLVRRSGNKGMVVAMHRRTGLVADKSMVHQFVTPQGWVILVPVGKVDNGLKEI